MNNQDSQYEYELKKNPASHYYGSLVRKSFVVVAVYFSAKTVRGLIIKM